MDIGGFCPDGRLVCTFIRLISTSLNLALPFFRTSMSFTSSPSTNQSPVNGMFNGRLLHMNCKKKKKRNKTKKKHNDCMLLFLSAKMTKLLEDSFFVFLFCKKKKLFCYLQTAVIKP